MKRTIKWILTPIFLLSFLASYAQKLKVTAELDSAEILMGYTSKLKISVEQPSNARVRFPLLKDGAGRSYIPLLNDSVELSTVYTIDTTRLAANRMLVNYNMRVQSFDSGYYKLPPFAFECDGELAESNSVHLKVLPVHVEADAEISPFTGVEEPEPLVDDLNNPDSPFVKWLKAYWWLCLILAALSVLLFWAVKKYRKEGTLLPVKPVIPPYTEATKALSLLHSQKLWESGREKQYYTELTFILRRYLSREFNIPALEMTSAQIIKALKDNQDLNSLREYLPELLNIADFVKYAKVRPLPQDNEKAYDTTSRFITEAHKIYQRKKEETETEGDTSKEIKNQNAHKRNIKVAKGAQNKKRRK